jgi:drug/metabolite transporter (DMT)-like permease
MTLTLLLLLFGNIAASTAVLFIKVSATHPMLLAAYRLILAALFLTPVFIREAKRHRVRLNFALVKPAILPGLVLGLHFITWITGARLTLSANSTLIVNMVPVAMPFLLYFLSRELVSKAEIAGTVTAIAGVVLMAGSDLHFEPGTFPGDVVCFVSMLLLALYMALAKRNNRQPSIWLYVVPLYYIGAAFSFTVSLFVTSPLAQPLTLRELGAAVGLAVLPTVIGHSIFNHAMTVLRGQIVSLFALSQFLFAAVFAYFLLDEIPSPVLYPATVLILGGTVITIVKRKGAKTPRLHAGGDLAEKP